MNVSAIELLFALAAGLCLGLWFYGGLLWTARRLPDSGHPVLLATASFLFRAATVAAGMMWLAHRHWTMALCALAGFVIVRIWMVRLVTAPRPCDSAARANLEAGP